MICSHTRPLNSHTAVGRLKTPRLTLWWQLSGAGGAVWAWQDSGEAQERLARDGAAPATRHGEVDPVGEGAPAPAALLGRGEPRRAGARANARVRRLRMRSPPPAAAAPLLRQRTSAGRRIGVSESRVPRQDAQGSAAPRTARNRHSAQRRRHQPPTCVCPTPAQKQEAAAPGVLSSYNRDVMLELWLYLACKHGCGLTTSPHSVAVLPALFERMREAGLGWRTFWDSFPCERLQRRGVGGI